MKPIFFSDRYSELIKFGEGEFEDHICDDIPYEINENISSILHVFNEPQTYYPNRYDKDYEISAKTLDIAIEYINNKYMYTHYNALYLEYMFTPHLFDLIEIQYRILSDEEKRDFQFTLNNMFTENDVPWLLHDGQMIKVDSKQFELDVKRRALEEMHLLSDSESIFQSAYDELINATEFFQKGNYAETIINAGKSYESILKIICNENNGSASQLIQKLISEEKLISPSEKQEEFKEKVLSSLPFIRNNYAAHGAGKDTETISPSLANLAIDLAAALDSYLIEEYKQKLISEDDSESILEQN